MLAAVMLSMLFAGSVAGGEYMPSVEICPSEAEAGSRVQLTVDKDTLPTLAVYCALLPSLTCVGPAMLIATTGVVLVTGVEPEPEDAELGMLLVVPQPITFVYIPAKMTHKAIFFEVSQVNLL
jgi:hypothetical protein